MRAALVLCLTALAVPALAQEAPSPEPTPLAAVLAEIRAAPAARHDELIERAKGLTGSAEEVVATIRAGLPRPETQAGWQVLRARDWEGVARPYHLYVPESVAEAGEPAPLLVDMHGGVSRPEFIDDASFEGRRTMWQEIADAHGFVLACPLGRGDCAWWTDAGVRHVRSVIRDAKRHAPIDSDRVVATGFSDGASGCWYLAMAMPTPFAAMIPLNGHPLVATGASGRQLYLRNAIAMPLFVGMTQDDGLYPAQTVLPHVQALIREGAQIHLVSYPTGGHTPAYLEDQQDALGAFVTGAMRDPLPDRIDWSTAHLEASFAGWLDVREIRAGEGDVPAEDVPDIQVMSTPGRVLIGIGIDREFTGVGVRVESVREGMPAGDLGLQVGDVVTAVDGRPVATLGDLREVLGDKRFGDPLSVRFVREGVAEPIEAATTIAPFTPEPTYTRERPTAWISLVRDGNTVHVASRNVGAFRLHVSAAQFDLDEEVVVIVNGIERARHVLTPDLDRVLEHWAAVADPGLLFETAIDVHIPSPE